LHAAILPNRPVWFNLDLAPAAISTVAPLPRKHRGRWSRGHVGGLGAPPLPSRAAFQFFSFSVFRLCNTIRRVIHPTAIVSPHAELGAEVAIGPYCVVGAGVVLGDRCRLHSHVILDGPCRIGTDNEFFPFAAVGGKTQDLKYAGEPTALEIGDRNVFRENSTVHRGTTAEIPTRIGCDNLLLCYSHIAHDCQLGNHIIISNNGALGGHVLVADFAIVSGLTAVHQFCRIGEHSITGGCSKITQDIPPFMIVDGNPAATRGLNLVGLQRRGFAEQDIRDLKTAYKRLFLRKDTNLANCLDALRVENAGNNPLVARLIAFIESSPRGVTR
jgi:UDP-N-acetylglucosamine acyltransferase